MLKIRLQRIGRRNDPSYRVVVVESSVAAKKGVPVELLGLHDTVRKKTSLNEDRIKYWLARGAKPSDTMHNVLITNGVVQGVKRNVLPKKNPIVQSDGESAEEASDSSDAEQTDQSDTASADDTPADTPPTDTADDAANNSQHAPSQEG